MNAIAPNTHLEPITRTSIRARRPSTTAARDLADCTPSNDTEALVQRMVLGDGVARDELMTRYGKRLRAIAMDILGDEDEAASTVNRVFEEACFGWPPERPGGALARAPRSPRGARSSHADGVRRMKRAPHELTAPSLP